MHLQSQRSLIVEKPEFSLYFTPGGQQRVMKQENGRQRKVLLQQGIESAMSETGELFLINPKWCTYSQSEFLGGFPMLFDKRLTFRVVVC